MLIAAFGPCEDLREEEVAFSDSDSTKSLTIKSALENVSRVKLLGLENAPRVAVVWPDNMEAVSADDGAMMDAVKWYCPVLLPELLLSPSRFHYSDFAVVLRSEKSRLVLRWVELYPYQDCLMLYGS